MYPTDNNLIFAAMKNILCLLVFLIFNLSSKANNLEKVDSLIKVRQYLSAWDILTNMENSTENGVDVHLKKIELSLKYFTKTVSHQLFSFSDVKPHQNLIELRQIAEKKMAQMYPYNIEKILDSLQVIYPNDFRLKKAQGDFYYDISILYDKDWIVNKQEVIRRMYDGYSKAEENGITDFISLYALGYFWNINEDSKKSINYFERSLELDSTYAPTHYNLAYLYTEKDSLEIALYHAWQAYNHYTYINYKNDAGQMAGSLLGKLNRHEEAISLLLDCDKLIPNTYYTYFYLLNSFSATNRIIEAQITAKNMFQLDWKSHTINTDIISIFIKNNQLDPLVQFYNDRLKEELHDMEYRGYIYLHTAQAYQMKSKQKEALEQLKLAEESFNICYDPGHPVFEVVKKMKR